jgi:bifunctional non-homologous end joining protein LigD
MTTITPMLASVGSEIPRGEGWVFEPKYDGIRVLGFASNNDISLVSRNGLDKTRQFPEIVDALRALHARAKRSFVVDGEIVALRDGSPARFQALQSRMHVTNREAIASHRDESPAALIVFDLLVDGKQALVAEPWRERRKHLAALLRPPGRSSALRLSDVADDGAAMLRKARSHGWEGIIAKRDDARYDVGHRSRAWLKLKIEHRQEFVVGGWTEPRKSREHIGALLLGYYDARGQLVYAGHTGTGFTRETLLETFRRLKRLERKTSPFATTPKTNEAAHWARPSLVAEIKFNEWTTDGKLRQPVFLGLRDDKPPREVVHEPESLPRESGTRHGRVRAAPVRRVAASATLKTTRRRGARATQGFASSRLSPRDADRIANQIDAIARDGGKGALDLPTGLLDVSKLDKIFFPKTKHTKGDVMRFYARIAPQLLPAIADRPLVMKRFPNGVRGKAFYQQRAPADRPESVRTEPVSDDGLTTQERIIGGDLATLLYVVQLGAISIDPWHSRVQSVKFADYAIIDLDPGPRARFARVVEVAHLVKDTLDELRLRAIPKTSGASGIHIVLPLRPGVPNDGARIVAEMVARRVAERAPKIATVERWVKSRPPGTVYVDFLQNIRGKTVAGVYSVRAQPVPSVSTPLTWDELDDRLDPLAFTIDTVVERVRDVGDLWAKAMKTPNSLDGILERG